MKGKWSYWEKLLNGLIYFSKFSEEENYLSQVNGSPAMLSGSNFVPLFILSLHCLPITKLETEVEECI